MSMPGSREVFTLAAVALVALTPLALPVVASAATGENAGIALSQNWVPAAPPPPPPPPPDWYHPEWGPGWNNGYPGAGWVPPDGWAPPADWANPSGWAPPPEWTPPWWWCSGPWRDMFHLRCR